MAKDLNALKKNLIDEKTEFQREKLCCDLELHSHTAACLRPLLDMEAVWRQERAAAAAAKLCPTLCDPIDGSPPGSPVPGILKARTLEWVAISFFNA